MNHVIIPFFLIPICAILNHLGGQSTVIPDPRITCRVFGVGVAFALISFLCELPLDQVIYAWAIVTAGMSFWATPANGEEFMALNSTPPQSDTHGKNGYAVFYWVCCKVLGVSLTQTLTQAQTRNWGTAYGVCLSTLMLPLFGGLSWLFTPLALIAWLPCMLQGFIYRFSGSVLTAEYRFGAIYGAALAATLIAYSLAH